MDQDVNRNIEGSLTMTYSLKLTIPGLPKITSNGSHGHWRAKAEHAKLWKRMISLHVGDLGPDKPLERAKLILTRHSSNEPDADNLAISFKPCVDGLVQAKVLVNDKPSNIGNPEYRWQKAPIKKGFITIEVEGI